MANDTIITTISDTTHGMSNTEPSDSGAMELLNKTYGYKLPSEEDRKKEQKRRKQQEIVSCISDAVRAMSNLFFASRGAPNMYDAEKSQTKQLKEQWDKADKEEKENARGYLDGYLKILSHKRKKELDKEQQEYRIKRDNEQKKRNSTLIRGTGGEELYFPNEMKTPSVMLELARHMDKDELAALGLLPDGKGGVKPLGTDYKTYLEYGTFEDSDYPNRTDYGIVKWDDLWKKINIEAERNPQLYDHIKKMVYK